MTDKARGEFVDPRAGASTFAEWEASWSAGRRVRESTKARDDSLIKTLVLPHLGQKKLGKITPAMLRAWVVELERIGLSAATIRKVFQLVGAMFEQAVRDGRLVRSPARFIELPRTTRSEMQFLTPDRVARLAGSIDPRYRVMVLTAAYTGLRFGELAGLRIEDLDLLRRRMRVVRTVNEVNGRVVIGEPKTAAGRRTVALPRFLIDEIAAHLATIQTPEGWVFPSPGGGPLRRNHFRVRFWLPAIKAAGLNDFRFHDLRHTHAALLIAANEHPKTIQSRLGHASISTTLDVYGHLFEGLDEAAAERLEHTFLNAAER